MSQIIWLDLTTHVEITFTQDAATGVATIKQLKYFGIDVWPHMDLLSRSLALIELHAYLHDQQKGLY